MGLTLPNMNKSYKDMTKSELSFEIIKVNGILRNKPSPHTYKQMKAYLERLERRYKTL